MKKRVNGSTLLINIRVRTSSAAGFTTLIAALATIAGLTFVLLMANLTRIVGAKDALDQSLRRGARCLTPTDGECAEYSGGVSTTQPPATHFRLFAPDTKHVVDTFAYRAAFERNTWQASYNSYLVHVVSPQLRYSSMDVPTMRYDAPFNAHEQAFARVKACGERLNGPIVPYNRSATARARLYFPSFKEGTAIEHLTERNQVDLESYQPYCWAYPGSGSCCPIDDLTSGRCTDIIPLTGLNNLANDDGNQGEFDYRPVDADTPPNTHRGCDSHNCGAILGAGERTAITATITVPTAPAMFTNPAVPCHAGVDRASDPVLCATAVNRMAGGGDVRNNAHIAWKVTAEVCRFNDNSAEMGWELGHIIPGDRYDQDQDGRYDHHPSRNGQGNQGGRDSVRMPHDMARCKWLGVWLRGPSSAHGGDSGWTHDNIEVPWGTTFRLRGWISNTASDASDRLIIRQVKFKVFSDRYDDPDTIADCRWCGGEYQQLPASGIEGPGSLAACGFSPAEGWTPRSSGNGMYEPVTWSLSPNNQGYLTRVVPSCSATASTFPVSLRDSAVSSCSRSGVMCNAGQTPSVTPASTCGGAPAHRTYCGWQGTQTGTQNVGEVNNCSTTRIESLITANNATYRSDSNYGEPMSFAQYAALQVRSDQLNAAQPAGFPVIRRTPPSEVRWLANEISGPSLHPSHPDTVQHSAQHFDYSWEPVRSTQVCSCPPAGPCAVESCTISNNKHSVQYRRNDTQWRPDFSVFPINAPASVNLVLSYAAAPPTWFLSDTWVSRTRTGIDFQDPVDTGYPFEQVAQQGFAYEIPYWGQESCDTGCTTDFPRGFATISAALREYVRRNATPAHRALAADGSIYLDTQAPPHHLAVEVDPSTELPACTPQRTQVSHRFIGEQLDETGACVEGTYPRWRDQTAEQYVCGGGTLFGSEHGGCFTSFGDTTINDNPVDGSFDLARAQAVSLAELRRIDSGVAVGCSEGQSGSCVDYQFDTTSEPGFANIQATYRVPIMFPLSTFLGQDFIAVEASKREPFEMEIAGLR